jgi:single stranded DNA-binding protein
MAIADAIDGSHDPEHNMSGIAAEMRRKGERFWRDDTELIDWAMTTEYAGNGKERPEFHNVVTWDRLAEVCGRYLGKGQQVAIEGRLQTRTWDDDKGLT